MSVSQQDASVAVDGARTAAERTREVAGRHVQPTTVPVRTPPPAYEQRRVTGGGRRADSLLVLGAAASAIGMTALIFTQFAPFDGALGFVVLSYVLFLGIYAALVSIDEGGPAIRDRLVGVIVHSLALVMLVALISVVVFTLWRGHSALAHLSFYLQDMAKTASLDPLTQGGIRHAAVGTLEQIAIALSITVPLGIVCAVFLSELPGPFSRFVRIVVEAMTALPSIVAGLFIYATVIVALNGLKDGRGVDLPKNLQWIAVGKSGVAAGLAISVMMLPIIIRAADVVLRLVPGNLREASLALGASQWRTVWHVVLPTARSGLTTAIILGTARGVGETSPVLLTAGFATRLNLNPTHDPQVSLPLFTFDSVRRAEEIMKARGYGAAAILMILVLILFIIARIFGGRPAGQLSRGQRRRRMSASHRDALRFVARQRARQQFDNDSPYGTPR
jgi:phosphate transport system permease protein